MVTLRAPFSFPITQTSPSISPPALSWLQGPWHVTHSTLPMWRKNRNVLITYTPIAGTSSAQIDDLVTYQPLNSSSIKTVHGVDRPFSVLENAPASDTAGGAASLAYNWRGKGWLMIVSSKWEILGYGEEEGTGNSWVVTYFAKTLFTPAGVDFYSRKGKLAPQTVKDIKAGLAGIGGDVAKLAGELFEITMDGGRKE